ncbi:protein FAM161B isoform X1 [Poecilia reticulata]|uniref:FAM161 centrosomal protein B n=1 Tax=Poecilia reticulata TaxID=8081 RepID=A0A3P9P1D7_POERE|nr:PREDICTED: protein FAM161B isoform X1 [Poecilia reticulata]XP_017158059.1 PREDICTED: protein FAM161B isoform X1 [Poecilia reticulata]XP_017158060.1 PREDICTED: protein FAM161B isoform X1 [Poecilia reticulata]XP_017158061.1 PREDICTED: protein FAM161B isoform X1 [Poecilia reticulata]
MSECDTLLVERLRSELMLKAHLKALRTALQLQLQETKSRQTEELDERIHQNTLLSSDKNQKYDDERFVERRSTPASALNSDKKAFQYHKQKPNMFSLSMVPSTNSKHCSVRAQQCERCPSSKTTVQKKEEEEEAECKKKFGAVPVPGHVIQPIYQEMMELREKERKQGHEQRMEFLLSIQKPFSFEERDKNKREKVTAVDPKNSVCVQKTFHINMKGTRQQKDQQEVCRNVQTQIASKQQNPAQAGCPKVRSADHTRKKKLGFLDEEPSFKPKIIPEVPDFKSLHKALQREALETKQSQDVTRCQPFFLRTSALPARKYKNSPETSQVSKMNNLGRSKSLGALTLISTDTLPMYITDAVRQRCVAIRKSMEIRESKNQESAEWLKSYQMRSQAMKKTVVLHAKLLDPHSSLKDVCNGNVQRHREADLQRMKDYMRELRDMKARVHERAYLFEQVKQNNAKTRAEQTFRRKLEKAGIKEQFVEETGESFRFDDTDTSSEKEIPSREENVEDGKKIEDVEDKSVKSKGEEMP